MKNKKVRKVSGLRGVLELRAEITSVRTPSILEVWGANSVGIRRNGEYLALGIRLPDKTKTFCELDYDEAKMICQRLKVSEFSDLVGKKLSVYQVNGKYAGVAA